MAVIASRGIVPKADKSKVEFLKNIEEKWQKKWSEAKIFEADPNDKPKFFLTFPYPYINAYPHLGSAYTVLRVDIVARFKRMKGFNVLFPQGWHATGGPIVAAALRVREGDPKQINVLKMMGISEEDIPKFKDPEYWVRFFKVAWKNDFKRYGLSIDWRREFYTTYLNPPYSKFVQWQYTKLREKGLIVKGEHPVVWCPKERKVVGDHDRPDQYVGIGPEEVIIIKFKSDDGLVFPCLTYRPETVYGAVNVWVNPEAEYFVAEVDGERWVLGEYGLNELRDQGRRVEIKGRIVGKEVLGKYVTNPVRGWRVPVLPASFVDPQMGTGVVMSVPAHAPYDYAALKDLKEKPQLLEKYGLSPDIVKGVEPVSIIRLEEYGDYPAVKIVEEMGIKSQNDFEKLEEATKEIYTKEFHKGVLKDVFGKWAGRIVGEVKQEIIEDLVSKRVALRHYTLPSMVICRCGSKTHVKIVKDQWFIKYSDPQWKKLAHECIDTMVFLPEDIREYFHSQVNWYGDWACTHKGELGTPLPWDPEWVLESLSDSTIYMAYYT
ncbi:MAG: leucine--tRNA ligase, partial [Thermoprotei archaeon]